ncbi:MAG: DUF4339 domain-containing protein [Planctomycetes bacterium]|nr:DUF4339 domain-containing protein [Planctomycetota bacterium]
MASQWYYMMEGQRMDPVTAAELRQLARAGLLKPTDLIWQSGIAQWIPASREQGLFPQEIAGTQAGAAPLSLPPYSKEK